MLTFSVDDRPGASSDDTGRRDRIERPERSDTRAKDVYENNPINQRQRVCSDTCSTVSDENSTPCSNNVLNKNASLIGHIGAYRGYQCGVHIILDSEQSEGASGPTFYNDVYFFFTVNTFSV